MGPLKLQVIGNKQSIFLTMQVICYPKIGKHAIIKKTGSKKGDSHLLKRSSY